MKKIETDNATVSTLEIMDSTPYSAESGGIISNNGLLPIFIS